MALFIVSQAVERGLCQVFVKSTPQAPPIASSDEQPETDANCLDERGVESWYRYWDLTPYVTLISL